MHRCFAAALLAVTLGAAGSAADPVAVPGTTVAFEPTAEVKVGDKTVRLNLTGVGVRSRAGVKAYAVASYLQNGTTARTPEDVAKADAVRMLHLVMLRTSQPTEFLGALRAGVARNYPADKFEKEFEQIAKAVGETAAKKGDHVTLLAVPGEGVRVKLADKIDVTVKSPEFARALWEVYLGREPVDRALKKELVGRLTP